uniref:Protein ripply3 n=2 Tax=Chinchilla lanigera TaxID=34839 RepID=A0A8C2V537_CHILA
REPRGHPQTLRSRGAFGFQHPVRLYLPMSKREEYLQGSGEDVLASFPVQATIHFYNDDSESESGSEADEEERGEEARPPELQRQEPKAQAGAAEPGCSAQQRKGRLPLGASPGAGAYSWSR